MPTRNSVLHSSKTPRGIRFQLDSYVNKRLDRLAKIHYRSRGHKMAVFAHDHISAAINVFGYYEKEDLEFLFEFLSPLNEVFRNGLALDIGANIGNHTLFFAPRFESIHAFEPNPPTYYLLKFNAGFTRNAEAHNIGLGDEAGAFTLVEDVTNIGASYIGAGKANEAVSEIWVERLDTLDIDRSRLCFIKMDVEGFEARVIRGGSDTLSRYQPLIVFEQLQKEFREGSTESIELLSQMGYKFCWHQSGTDSASRIMRRYFKTKEFFFGRTHRIVSSPVVPKRTYSMLIAVPPRFQRLLGME